MNGYAYDESSRRRWVLIAGAVLAIAALLAVAFIAGRTTAPAGGGRAPGHPGVRLAAAPMRWRGWRPGVLF